MPTNTAGQARILVIDDEEVVHASMSRVLSGAGYEVQSTFAARDGLQRLQSEHYDLVITDLMMPEMSGIELLEALDGEDIHVPTIMVTGYPTIRTALQALRLGAVDYVAKPFTRKELLAPVTRALHHQAEGPATEPQERSSADGTVLQPGTVLYLPNHSWAQFEQDGSFLIGVERSFLSSLGTVLGLSAPPVNEVVEQGMTGIVVTAGCNEQHGVALPLTGTVTARNQETLAAPALLTPQTWLLRLQARDPDSELENLALRDDPEPPGRS